MCTLRDVVIFFAGFEFFHTLSHIFMPMMITLPLQTKIVLLTPNLNIWAIIINAVITIALIWWACYLGRRKASK